MRQQAQRHLYVNKRHWYELKQEHEKNYVLILFILAFGTTVLYSFTLIHGVTGLATGDTPPECQNYATENDLYCDDDKEVCADKYVDGKSLPASTNVSYEILESWRRGQ